MTRGNGLICCAAGALFAALLAFGVEAPEGADRGEFWRLHGASPAAQAMRASAPALQTEAAPVVVAAR